jgi:cobyrinic acid a,c-diamide synthase
LIEKFEEHSQGADLVLVEGAMGLYDGLDESGTTAEIARLFRLPILLVVNTTRMTTSIAAMVSGYQHFQKDISIAGVILNYVAGDRHDRKLREAVEHHCRIPVVGSVPKDPDLRIAERHLGLIPSGESGETEQLVERIGRKLEPHFDVDRILEIVKGFEDNPPSPPFRKGGKEEGFREGAGEGVTQPSRGHRVKIGVIRDRAFNFYYPENLEALIQEGAELIFIDSLSDRLPAIDGFYIGGGFPEFFLEALEANQGLRGDIAKAIEGGLPAYAECAGLMYLCRTISWQDRSYAMVGAIPCDVHLSERPAGHGYVIAEVTAENPVFPRGVTIRGHEFHHSGLRGTDGLSFAYEMKRGQGISGRNDGVVIKNLLASYVHVHALGTPEWARGFVSLASKVKRSNSDAARG